MSGMVEGPKMRENGRISSSPGLSSPPTPSSPTNAKAPTQSPFITSAHSHSPPHHSQFPAAHGGEKTEAADAKNILAPGKKARKKRDPNNTAKKRAEAKNGMTSTPPTFPLDGADVVVKQRKPRAAPGTSSRGRRSKAISATHADVALAQSNITDPLASSQQPANVLAPPTFLPSQNGNHEAIPTPPDSNYIPPYTHQSSTPRVSGQNYDPIRSSTVETRPQPPTPSNHHLRSPTPPRPVTYGSASNSPAISSLIDPPSHVQYPPLKRDSDVHGPSSSPKKLRLTPPEEAVVIQQQVPEPPHRLSLPSNALPITNDAPVPMDVDKVDPAPIKAPPIVRKSTTTSGTSTPAASKAARQKEGPVASGNGLLSIALFGGPADNTGSEKTAPTVVIDVPLNGENNKYINFARLAEERYGFNALHPRLAAQRERLARVAAAGAALENAEKKAANGGTSADDMSVDLSEGDAAGDDSNVEMGGMSLIERDVLGQGGSPADGSEGPKKRKKRVMKEDQYDKGDPFVDDTELAWEEQAAASKDGFFVYSGPLKPEGEEPNVERSDGPPKRGRGGGRGRGSGRGSRGGATKATPGARKPRVTKAAKMQMDQEKVQRESMAVLAAKPTTYPG